MTLPAGWVLAPGIGIDQAAAHAYRAGFRAEGGAIMLAIAMAESSLIPNNRNVNTDSRRTVDRGILQINSYWHAEVTDAQADDPASAFVAGYRISAGGTAFGQWSTYNGGQYKPHLADARLAMAHATALAGGASSGSLPVIETVVYDDATGDIASTAIPQSLVEVPARPLTVAALRCRGQAWERLPFAPWVTSCRLELSVDEVSKLDIVVADPIGAGFNFTIGTDIDLGDLRFRVTDLDHGPSAGALEELHVTALSLPAEKMRQAESYGHAKTWVNMAANEVLLEEVTPLGLKLVAEGGAVYPQLTRLGTADESEGAAYDRALKDRAESNWEFSDRLATREGKWRFEAGGTLYYGRPSWLVKRMTKFTVRWRHPIGAGHLTPLEAPQLQRGVDEERATRAAGPRSISVALPRGLADRIRPGMVMQYSGTLQWETRPFASYFGTPEGYLVTQVSIDLLDEAAGVIVAAREAVDPKAVPEEGDPTQPSSTTTATTPAAPRSAAKGSALDMVTAMLRQVGDSYIFGAEADPKDPDPDTFDCSELVQWACAQVGVDFVDYTGNQIAAVAAAGLELTVAQCATIRGALLWRPGHVAVSLGDGRSTIEARGRAYGVVQYVIGDRFTRGGKIPGLDYGAGIATAPVTRV